MNGYILCIQKHMLPHSWTLDVTHGSTMHQDAWMCPFFNHLLYVLYNILKIFKLPPPQWRNSPLWARVSSLSWLHDYSDTPHSIGLLWASDQPSAKTSTQQHTTLKRNRHSCPQWDLNSQSLHVYSHRPMPRTAQPLGSARMFQYCTYSHLVGRPVLIHITSWLNNQSCLHTVSKSLTKLLPKMLHVNAPKSSPNWFMTGHSTLGAIQMLTW
jgi:hypothetical protein